jgi:hypothetical protein
LPQTKASPEKLRARASLRPGIIYAGMTMAQLRPAMKNGGYGAADV